MVNMFQAMGRAHKAFYLPEDAEVQPWPTGYWSVVAKIDGVTFQVATINMATGLVRPSKDGVKYQKPQEVLNSRRN